MADVFQAAGQPPGSPLFAKKRCPACGEQKDPAGFNRNRASRDGLQSECRPCMKARTAAGPKHNPKPQPVERQCQFCGATFYVAASKFAARQRQRGESAYRYCSKLCVNAAHTTPIVDGTKVCSGCNQVLPLEAFTMLHGKPRHKCKSCSAANMRQHRANHPERRDDRIAAKRAWDDANREHVREHRQRYNAEHKTEATERQRAWRMGPERERILARGKVRYRQMVASGYVKEYYEANRGRWRERERRYWRTNRARYLEKEAQRRARKRGSQREPVNRLAIIARDASTCYLCKVVLELRRVTLDHVVPLVRGGSHTADNLRVACKPCNSRKHKKLLSELNWSEEEGWLPDPTPRATPRRNARR